MPLAKRTVAEQQGWGKSSPGDGMLFRASEACEACEACGRTLFITEFDDWTSRMIEQKLGKEGVE